MKAYEALSKAKVGETIGRRADINGEIVEHYSITKKPLKYNNGDKAGCLESNDWEVLQDKVDVTFNGESFKISKESAKSFKESLNKMKLQEKIMELKELVGKHVLDGVDFGVEKSKNFCNDIIDCNAIHFRLDGIVYTALEDPEGGYRSCMKGLVVSERDVKNSFSPIEVVCVYKTDGEYGETDDVVEIIDTQTGLVVVRVGTRNIDDYYPSYEATFNPENMVLNKGRVG